MKWVVFVATGYAQIAVNHGGINVFAFDLKTGVKLWRFSDEYADSVNDIPGAVTVYDTDGDSFADRVYVGDMNGRLWELNALDGTNPNGTQISGTDAGKQIPLFNAGIGKPISVSPAIITQSNHTILVFGTGGADWASNASTYAVYAVDATAKRSTPTYATGAGTLLWQYNLSTGEKVWSTPTIANGQIYVVTAFGTMESSDPGQDARGDWVSRPATFAASTWPEGSLLWSMSQYRQGARLHLRGPPAHLSDHHRQPGHPDRRGGLCGRHRKSGGGEELEAVLTRRRRVKTSAQREKSAALEERACRPLRSVRLRRT